MAEMNGTSSGARSTPWLAVSALWLAIGLIDACQTVFPMRAQGMHHAWVALFVMLAVHWLPWALATPLLVDVAYRYPLFRKPTARGALAHVALFALLSVATAAWYASFEYGLNPWALTDPPDSYLRVMVFELSYGVLTSFLAYALVLVIIEFLSSRDRLARSQTEAAELRAELSDAKLVALRQQMDPHFIFNALNSVCGLVRAAQNDTAVRMLLSVSDYLRTAVDRTQQPLVTLQKELHQVTRYLDIQKFRFGTRLQVVIDVPKDLLSTAVPSLLLQPLAENAIKHGISARSDGGAIRVSGSRLNDRLQLVIRNSAPRVHGAEDYKGLGIGLTNLRARLKLLYGDQYELVLHQCCDTGDVDVQLVLPIRGEFVNADD